MADDSSIEKRSTSDDILDLKSQLPNLASVSDDELAAFARKDISWTPAEERALVFKYDVRIMPLVTLFYLFSFLDRTNIGNAKVAGLEKSVGLKGYEYNIGLSIFYILYAVTEIPSNLFLKRIGATIWIPSLVLSFGLVCTTTALITDFAGFMSVRVFLGFAEGGLMPGIAYYLSNWYKRDELALRIGLFVSASSLSGAFSGLLATALLSAPQMDGLPLGRWRNIFLIEGVLTMALGLVGYAFLPAAPEKNRFLNEREKTIGMERMRTENAGLNAAEKMEWKLVGRAFANMSTWICAFAAMLSNITIQGVALFMPTLLGGLGYSGIKLQLLTVPPYIAASIFMVFVLWGCNKTSRRGVWALSIIPIAILGSSLLIGSTNRKVGYAGIFFLTMGIFPTGPLFISWGLNNSAPYTTRAVASGLIIGFGSFGPIISAWSFLPTDGPRYLKGLSIQLGAQCGMVLFTVFLILWNSRENRLRKLGKRDYRLNADESTVRTLGNRHPKFRLTI